MTDNEMWAAGFLSGMGSFFLIDRKGRKVVALTLSSKTKSQAIIRFAQIAGVNAIMSEKGMKVNVTGQPLHNLLRRLWDELTVERKQEYARLRKQATPDPWEH
jgi:hypothetical protein